MEILVEFLIGIVTYMAIISYVRNLLLEKRIKELEVALTQAFNFINGKIAYANKKIEEVKK